MFSVRGLSVAFENTPVLRSVSFDIKQGECVALIGQNGSGKSTLCSCLLGIIPYLQSALVNGQVVIDGVPTTSQDNQKIRRRVGFTLENPEAQFVSLSVAEEVALTLAAHGREVSMETIRTALDHFGIISLLERDPRTLSEGEKRRVTLAALEAAQPEAMVLDEPTSALDSAGQVAITEFLNRNKLRGCTIFFSTHNIDSIERSAQRYIGLRSGVLVADRFVVSGNVIDEDVFPRRHAPIESLPKPRQVDNADGFVLEGRALAYSYPRAGKKLVKNVDLALRAGDVLIVRGPNGSGKTTLLYLLAGLIRPSKGTVQILGLPPREIPMASRTEICGMVFQNPDHQILMYQVDEEMLSGLRSSRRIDTEVIEWLEWIRRVLPIPAGEQDPHTLSLGQKKMLALATALAPRPLLLLLDEPELGLDPVQKVRLAEILEMLRKHWGVAMVLSTHDSVIIQRLTNTRILELE